MENVLLDLDETIAAIYLRSRNDRSIFVMFLVLKSPRVKEKGRPLLNCLWLGYCCQGIRWFWPLEGDKLGPSPGHV